MKKRNVMVHSAIAAVLLGMFGAANAGTLVTSVVGGTVFAAENFGSTANSTALNLPSPVTYSFSTATSLNAGGTVYFLIRLTGGKFAAAPAFGTFKFAGSTPNGSSPSGAAVGYVGSLSTDKTTLQVAITAGNTNISLGLGALLYTPSATDIDNVSATLKTAGGTVSATIAVTSTTASSAGSMDSTNALATSIDAPAPTAALAVSANAIAPAVDALASYTNKIDLTASPVASNFTSVSNIALGAVKFVDIAGTQGNNAGGSVDYTVVSGSNAGAATATITVTPGAGQSFPIGSTLQADISSSACATLIGTATTAITALTTSSTQTISVAANSVLGTSTGTPIFVCMSKPSTGNTVSPITATLVGTLVPAVSTDIARTVTGIGYPVVFNGSQIDLRSYIPAVSAGYTGYIRVINTGAVAAAVSGQWIYENGTLGTAATFISSLASGASSTLSSAQVEAALGAPTVIGLNRPRLRITGPTNGLNAQSFILTNANGNFSDTTGAQ